MSTGTLNIRGVSPVRRRATGSSGPFVPSRIMQYFWDTASRNNMRAFAQHSTLNMWSDEFVEV